MAIPDLFKSKLKYSSPGIQNKKIDTTINQPILVNNIVKTLITVLAILAFHSCGEKADEPQPSKKCNCGIVQTRNSDSAGNPYLMVKNNCSEKIKKFYVEWGVWNNIKSGEEVCFNNVDSWK